MKDFTSFSSGLQFKDALRVGSVSPISAKYAVEEELRSMEGLGNPVGTRQPHHLPSRNGERALPTFAARIFPIVM